jgi:hypothetical protein
MQKHSINFEICICTSVFSVRYSNSEQFLVSTGADSQILGTSCFLMYVLPYVCMYVCMYVVVWSMLSLTIVRRLLGHSDVVYSLAMDGKRSVLISGSHDQVSHLSVFLYIYIYNPCMYVCMYVCITAGEKLVYHSAQSRGSGSAENRRSGLCAYIRLI